MVSTWMSIPSLSMSAMRSAPSARPPAWRSNGVPFDDLRHAVDGAVRVHVDDGDALAADRDLLARARGRRGAAAAATSARPTPSLRERGQLASRDVGACRGARDGLQEISSVLHWFPFTTRSLRRAFGLTFVACCVPCAPRG